MPRNIEAIKDWVRANRPDLTTTVDRAVMDDKVWLLMAIAFEAGREFQRKDPEAVPGPSAYFDA